MILPTVEVVGKEGRIVINQTDLERYKAMGYKTVEEDLAEKEEVPKKKK